VGEYLAFIDSWITKMATDVVDVDHYLRYQEYRWYRHEELAQGDISGLFRKLMPEWINQRFDTQYLPTWDTEYHLRMKPEFVTPLPSSLMNAVMIEETRCTTTPLNTYSTNRLALVMSALVLQHFGLKPQLIRFTLLDSLVIHEVPVTPKLIKQATRHLQCTLTNGVEAEVKKRLFSPKNKCCIWCRYFVICQELIENE
jgi:hypothetical protein